MRPSTLTLTLLSLSLGACGDKGGDDTGSAGGSPDSDGDGYTADEDCDDHDADVFPGAVELCNGADDDCDSEIDEDAADQGTWFPDGDGDGYGVGGEGMTACDQPEGFSASSGDCDDDNASISPDAEELCNELDDNCDGDVDEGVLQTFYGDADKDGFGDDASSTTACEQPPDTAEDGGDCDDNDGSVYPGAEEVCGDGVVNDCAGTLEDALATCPVEWESTVSDGAMRFTGTQTSAQAGYSVASGGDVNGDGMDDLLVGAPYMNDVPLGYVGGAWLQLGGATSGGSLADADVSGLGGVPYSYLGLAVDIAPDLDGDGLDDVLVGAPATGEGVPGTTYVILGSTTVAFDEADGVIAPSTNGRPGSSVAGVGDVNGDGLGDVLIGNPYAYDEGYSGEAYLVMGPATGTLAEADVTFSASGSSTLFSGKAVAGAGDVDGDGLMDMLVSAPYTSYEGTPAGMVYLVSGDGSIASGSLPSVASATVTGIASYAYLGDALAGVGDFDGDGLDDVAMAEPQASVGDYGEGRVYVFAGGLTGEVDTTAATATFEGDVYAGFAGRSISGAGDVDGDGLDDLLVGAPGDYTEGAESGGEVYLVLGGAVGTITPSTAATFTSGDSTADGLGLSVSSGDFNGDGIPDVMMGAPGDDDGGNNSGSAYVLLNDFSY